MFQQSSSNVMTGAGGGGGGAGYMSPRISSPARDGPGICHYFSTIKSSYYVKGWVNRLVV